MKRSVAVVCLALLGAAPAAAQSPIRYEVDLSNRVHHEARITVRISDLDPGPVELRMSRTSPGRYALHEFAKNVYSFRATDAAGRELAVSRPDLHQWTVSGHGGELVASYTLYGDRADGTYAGIDETHAHLNIPATFMWARGLGERPVEVRFRLPAGAGWNVATQLVPTADPEVFTAPNLAYFVDSPTHLGPSEVREWTVSGPNGPQTLRIAVHHQDDRASLDRYLAAAQAIAAEEAAVFGEYARFDYGVYTFVACYLPWSFGDGMEHRNSTSLTSSGSLGRNFMGLVGTLAHEFFHSWNMERIRGAALEPFDLEEAVMSGELWFGEGFTNYYDQLAVTRAGLLTAEEFARAMGGTVDAIVNGPGRQYFSPVEMSMQAPFVDAAVSVDVTNRANTFLSYYTYGEFLALALDLTLRSRVGGLAVTLDDFMREVWGKHGRVEIPFTVDDLETALGEVTKDPAFAADFFWRFVRGREVPQMDLLLARAGVRLHKANAGMPILSRGRLTLVEGGLRVEGATLIGDPIHQAGLDRGDLITRVGGVALDAVGALERALDGKRPGDRVEVEWQGRGARHRAEVTLAESPTLTATPEEVLAGGRLGDAERAFRARWLTSRAGAPAR
jgi:predicted metalloprotease with PDZ domain